MLRRFGRILPSITFALLSAGLAHAQFVVLNEDDDTIEQLANGATLSFESEGVGATVVKRIEVTFTGIGNARLTVREPNLQGSTAFTLSGDRNFPVSLDPEDRVDFLVRFNPTGIGPFTTRLTLTLEQVNVRTGGTTTTSFLVNLHGVVADYALAYQLPGGNETPVADGGVVLFEDTEIDSSTTATIIVTNRGTGPGTVEGVAVDGGGVFVAGGLQLLPATVNAESALRYSVTFSPEDLGEFAGSMRVDFGQGSRAVGLRGLAVAPAYSYQTVVDGVVAELMDRGTLTLPSTPVGEEVEISVQVVNNGTLDGVINRISVAGTGFAVDDLPIIPAMLEPGEGFTFTLLFTPEEPGSTPGQLQIGDARFTLEGIGSGSELTYRTTSSAGTVDVEARDTIVFPPTSLGGSNDLRFEITNSGNEDRTVTLVGASGASFSVKGLPGLPVVIPGNGSVAFDVVFEPAGTGAINGSLAVDGVTFTLSGVGAEPPELSQVSIGGGGGVTAAAQQIATGVSIAEAYPVDLSGVLTLTFESDAFANDPAVQFARGGRTVAFEIPAGATQAVFPSGSVETRFQTGTIAGVIILTPTFSVDSANVDVTPDPKPQLRFLLASDAPRLIDASFGQFTNTGFSILLTGYSTSRAVDRLTLSVQGNNLSGSGSEVAVSNQFAAWYANGQSTSFGSLFTATLNFVVDGSTSDVTSVSVTAANALGASESVSVTLPVN